jgi:hypothetical protein
MRYQFAAGRLQIPFLPEDVSTPADGFTLNTRSLYLAVVGQNTGGVNLLSSVVGPVTVGVGESLEWNIPETARLAGEEWDSFVLGASLTSTPANFVQLGRVNGRSLLGGKEPLPLVLRLDRDTHFELSKVVATPDLLPAFPVHGMLRAVTSLSGSIFEYDALDNRAANGTTILVASVGRWILKPGNFSIHVDSTLDGGGCNRPISLIAATDLRTRRYSANGASGASRIFWLNNTSESEIAAGLRVGLTVDLDGVSQGAAFSGLLRVRFLGYANSNTGTLRTKFADGSDFPDIGLEKSYENRKTDLVLCDALLPGEAYALEVYPQFSSVQLNGGIPQNAVVRVAPFLFAQQGSFAEAGAALGDWIYPQDDRGWVVPDGGLSATSLKRSGMVQGREFLKVGPDTVHGFLPDLAGQQVVINGNGAIYRRAGVIDANERLRAIVSTASGVGTPSPWSQPTMVSGSDGLAVTCTYPSNGSKATIRGDYPDGIAGLSGKASLNAPLVTIYVQSGNEIRAFYGHVVMDSTTQTFNIGSWNDGEVLSALPMAPAPDFGLFEAVAVAVQPSGSGTFPQGQLRVCFAFDYDGSAISAISHEPSLGCVHVASMQLAEIERSAAHWATSISDVQVAAIAKSVSWQTRRTSKGHRIVYRPTSRRMADGVYTWLPQGKLASQPGRWEVDWHQEFIGLPFLDVPPPTGDREIVLFADANGVLRQRMPNNGGVLPLAGGGGAGAGGEFPRVGNLDELRQRATQDYAFVMLVESLKIFFYNPSSLWDDDNLEVIRPLNVPPDSPGRWEAYPSNLNRYSIKAALGIQAEVIQSEVVLVPVSLNAAVTAITPVPVDIGIQAFVDIDIMPLLDIISLVEVEVEVATRELQVVSSWSLNANPFVDAIGGYTLTPQGFNALLSDSVQLNDGVNGGFLSSSAPVYLAPYGFVMTLEFWIEDLTSTIVLAERVSASQSGQYEWQLRCEPSFLGRKLVLERYWFNEEFDVRVSRVNEIDGVVDLEQWHEISFEINPAGSYLAVDAFNNSESAPAYELLASLGYADMELRFGSQSGNELRLKNAAFSKY